MTTRTADRIDFLTDVLITAAEGGFMQWAQLNGWRYADDVAPADRKVTLTEIGDGDVSNDFTVTLDTIARGIGRIIAKDSAVDLHRDYVKDIMLANRENDAGDIDAISADAIVQAGLFGQVIYG